MTIKYEIELTDLRIDLDKLRRDNNNYIEHSLTRLQLIIEDIDKRLKALE